MTTATYTQGLQAMYPAYQQPVFQGMQPWYSPQLIALEIHEQQIATELFKLAQQVQHSSQLVGPQPGRPSKQLIAAELFRLAQQVQQAIPISQTGGGMVPMAQQQPFPQYGQGVGVPFGPGGQYGQASPFGQGGQYGHIGHGAPYQAQFQPQFQPQYGVPGQLPIWS